MKLPDEDVLRLREGELLWLPEPEDDTVVLEDTEADLLRVGELV